MDPAREEQLIKYTDELRELRRKALDDFRKALDEWDAAMLKYEQGVGPKPQGKKPEYKEPEVPDEWKERFNLLKHVWGGTRRRGRKSRSSRRRKSRSTRRR
jgi:hypothetical protein